MPERLNQSYISRLQPRDKRYSISDAQVLGLYVDVFPSGKKIYYVQFYKKNGSHTKKKVGDASILTVTQAREAAQLFLANILLGNEPEEKDKIIEPTIEDIFNKYKEIWVITHKSGRETTRTIQSNFLSYLSGKKVTDLTALDINKWCCLMRERKPPMKYRTINRYTSQLIAMINWAVEMGIIKANPIKIKKLKEIDSNNITRYLSDEERKRFYAALDEREKRIKESRRKTRQHTAKKHLPDLENVSYVDAFQPVVLLALNTGIRRNALLSLKWEEIDFQADTILLSANTAKGSKTDIVPMNKTVRSVLEAWQKQTGKKSGLLFVNPQTGTKYKDFNSSWEALLKEAKIENFRWHDMRHDFASRLVMADVNLYTVKELLTHADIKMTQRYAHLAPEKKKAAVDSICYNNGGT